MNINKLINEKRKNVVYIAQNIKRNCKSSVFMKFCDKTKAAYGMALDASEEIVEKYRQPAE